MPNLTAGGRSAGRCPVPTASAATAEPAGRLPIRVPIFAGSAAALGLLAFYLGLITLAQGWRHAVEQLALDHWYVQTIMIGLGTQVGLFMVLRGRHARTHGAGTAAGGMTASTGTSAAAMLACCAHHLTEVLAVIGLAGAAAFLTEYKPLLLWSGIGMNLAGIMYLAWLLRRAGTVPAN